MLKVWQLHRDASNIIGDPVTASSSSLPDGARFFKTHRDNYINRALTEVIRDLVQPIITAPKNVRATYAMNMFPNMIIKGIYSNVVSGQGGQPIPLSSLNSPSTSLQDTQVLLPALFLSAYLAPSLNATDFRIPVPILDSHTANNRHNTRFTQDPDPYAVVYVHQGSLRTMATGVDLILYDQQDIIGSYNGDVNLYCDYIVYPRDVAQQDPNDDVIFEPRFLNLLYEKILKFSKLDDQDDQVYLQTTAASAQRTQ